MVAAVVVDEKVTGLAKAAVTQIFHGVTNAIDARSQKVIMYIVYTHRITLKSIRFDVLIE